MRISDWSSDVCSSDLAREFRPQLVYAEREDDYIRERIATGALAADWSFMEAMAAQPQVDVVVVGTFGAAGLSPTLSAVAAGQDVARSDARRVGEEWVSTCRFRWPPYP